MTRTPKGAIRRARQYAGEEAEELLKGRFRIIKYVYPIPLIAQAPHRNNAVSSQLISFPLYSVWRPINGPVQDWPLATMDGKSLREENLHATDLWKNRWEELGSTYNISHGEGQKWYYLGEQRTDEALLIKIYDSKADVAAKREFFFSSFWGPGI